jgi:hypothetical protein
LRHLHVVVWGESQKHVSFRERTSTIAFNAHGALLVLNAKVVMGQEVLIINPTTGSGREARVVYITPALGGKAHVGIEFLHPSPEFWPLDVTAKDWKLEPKTAQQFQLLSAAWALFIHFTKWLMSAK